MVLETSRERQRQKAVNEGGLLCPACREVIGFRPAISALAMGAPVAVFAYRYVGIKDVTRMSKSGPQDGNSPSRLIDGRIKELGDWRGAMLGRLRALIKDADPEVVEEWKWRGVPVWSHDGIICTGETYKSVVKMTFAKGASLKDPARLFNSSLEGNVRRAIDFHEGAAIDEAALKALIRAAVTLNTEKSASKAAAKTAKRGARGGKPARAKGR